MYVQIMLFDGPRSDEAVEASRRAGVDRIAPLIASHPDLRDRLLGGMRAVGPDGAECIIELAADEAALDEVGRLVMSSELLPGENLALLSGPDRIERYETVDVFGPLADPLARTTR